MIRGLAMLVALAGITSPAAAQPREAARADAKLARLTAGRVAGSPVRCIRPERSVLPETIDRRALAYRTPRGLYVGALAEDGGNGPGCSYLREGRTAVTSSINGQLCLGDRVRIVEAGMLIGQCHFGDFTPYSKPR